MFTTDKRLMILFFCLSLICLWYVATAVWELWSYYRWDTRVMPTELVWSVKQKDDDTFAVVGGYSYEVAGQNLYGQVEMEGPLLRSPWAAATYQKKLDDQTHHVWYNSHKPSSSTIDKTFPWKEVVYGIIMAGLLLYFFALVYYYKQ